VDGAVRRLLLFRHAKSSWKDSSLDDFDRPLNTRGRVAAPRMASWLVEQGYLPDLVLCSAAKRARETWDLASPAFPSPPRLSVEPDLYMASPARIQELVRLTDPAVETLLVIGHNPGLEQLASSLIGDNDTAAARQLRHKFPTAAVAVFGVAAHWHTLTPCSLLAFATPTTCRSALKHAASRPAVCLTPVPTPSLSPSPRPSPACQGVPMVMRRALRHVLPVLLLSVGSPALAQQSVDAAYTEKIREFTTEPFFLTPLIESLPASDRVPTPLGVLGRIAGAADVLSYPDEVYRYMRAVDEASDRVRVFSMGQTEEGREQILVVVASEQTLARLDDYKAMLARLADPRRTPEAEARRIIADGKPIYWATGAIHSPETGSPEMLMELVYRLAVDEGEFVKTIRDNIIFMATPIVEVDGRAKQVDLHMARRKDPEANVPTQLLYWGKYVAHDNNRDGMGLSLNLMQNVMKTFREYNPTVFHDLHESASYLYTSTGRGPYNPNIDPVLVNEWNRLAYKEVKDMTAFGVPGVYTYDFYDGWAPNYMFWVANMRNSIGRFYETQGSGNGSTRLLNVNVQRQWHRPSTPLPQVAWSIRNNVNLQQSALLIALNEVASNRAEYLEGFYLKSQRSVAKARTEGPAAYVFPGDDPRPGQQARLLSLLQRHGIEVHRAEQPLRAGDRTYAAGSYVVRMDQPYSRTADILLDRQYYNAEDLRPYDDVGWTHGPLFNVRTERVEEVSLLDAPMSLVSDPVRASGGIENAAGATAFIINYNADNNLTAFRFRHRDLRVNAAETAFEVNGRAFGAGSFIVPVSGNPRNVATLVEEAAAEFGFTAVGVAAAPAVATHPVATPRIAVMHTWLTTQTEGWLRIGLDEYGVPYEYISVHDVRDNARLRDRYDVILFAQSVNDPMQILHGRQGDRPQPWKKTDITPNIGVQASTDDMRGGLEYSGLLNLDRFVRAGGTLITITNSTALPIHFGLARGVSQRDTDGLWARGGVFRTTVVDRTSPLTYGYDDELGVYFNSGPVLSVAGDPAPRAPQAIDAGSTTARASGRGGIDDQDIPQGRARDAGTASVEALRARQGEGETQGGGGFGGFGAQIPAGEQPRSVLRFHEDPAQLLISGGLQNGWRMAGSSALIDAPVGSGHVVMFAFNPFWRGGTLGSYALLFNALLHHGNLGVGRTVTDQ
jgi:phosphohistidine phosphatase SixA